MSFYTTSETLILSAVKKQTKNKCLNHEKRFKCAYIKKSYIRWIISWIMEILSLVVGGCTHTVKLRQIVTEGVKPTPLNKQMVWHEPKTECRTSGFHLFPVFLSIVNIKKEPGESWTVPTERQTEREQERARERAEDTVLHQGPDNQNVVSASLVLQTERAEEILFFLLHFNATLLRALWGKEWRNRELKHHAQKGRIR